MRNYLNQYSKGIFFVFLLIFTFVSHGNQLSDLSKWDAFWISFGSDSNKANSWTAFRKTIVIKNVPSSAITAISADSKYWLWINGELVVFEGGIKRGPTPNDTYYDEIDILKSGINTIAVLAWYFGKEGFSHKSSGKAGFIFDCQTPDFQILSDKSWRCTLVKAYQSAILSVPNSRLSEANILYDARLDLGKWQEDNYPENEMMAAVELGKAGVAPWNKLILRPVPLWKDFGLKKYTNQKFSPSSIVDTIICELPYNAQITPYFKLEPSSGQKIVVCTDNYLFYNGGDHNIRAEYLTI